MKKRRVVALLVGCLAGPALSLAVDAPEAAATPTPAPYVPDPAFPPQPKPPALTPEEELKTFQRPPGYHLEG